MLLTLLGLWGGLMPFIGPYAYFGFAPESAWHFTTDRLWLIILPAVATIIGGLILMFAANRAVAMFGGWLAAAGGLWFVAGGTIAALWGGGLGAPLGDSLGHRVAVVLSLTTGLGALITMLAGLALGRFAVVGVREARRAEAAAAAGTGAGAERGAPRQGAAPEWERTGENRGRPVPAHGRAGRNSSERAAGELRDRH
ncbi:hypothetical protein [Actinomadura rayongensis]|uniref:Uncharacterized protein n=1 Tax=Actinomadura rayongensis TaxID=1429076 RepID=A0A6I4W415_9ACTN|nr:hypothetical protein [Actinomadura rayongensis]MXQ64168.1 hypothetical protein [Actinomadura rayongensis]